MPLLLLPPVKTPIVAQHAAISRPDSPLIAPTPRTCRTSRAHLFPRGLRRSLPEHHSVQRAKTDLARATLDDDVAVLAKGRALHRERHGRAGRGRLEGLLVLLGANRIVGGGEER